MLPYTRLLRFVIMKNTKDFRFPNLHGTSHGILYWRTEQSVTYIVSKKSAPQNVWTQCNTTLGSCQFLAIPNDIWIAINHTGDNLAIELLIARVESELELVLKWVEKNDSNHILDDQYISREALTSHYIQIPLQAESMKPLPNLSNVNQQKERTVLTKIPLLLIQSLRCASDIAQYKNLIHLHGKESSTFLIQISFLRAW